eukprot:2356222-Rhodomonas_salina.1
MHSLCLAMRDRSTAISVPHTADPVPRTTPTKADTAPGSRAGGACAESCQERRARLEEEDG